MKKKVIMNLRLRTNSLNLKNRKRKSNSHIKREFKNYKKKQNHTFRQTQNGWKFNQVKKNKTLMELKVDVVVAQVIVVVQHQFIYLIGSSSFTFSDFLSHGLLSTEKNSSYCMQELGGGHGQFSLLILLPLYLHSSYLIVYLQIKVGITTLV